MADMFGGFSGSFRAAYDDTWPLQPGYLRRRWENGGARFRGFARCSPTQYHPC